LGNWGLDGDSWTFYFVHSPQVVDFDQIRIDWSNTKKGMMHKKLFILYSELCVL
jgi:hypothetical protein